jgi:DNA-binding MarR family transcriptional regulator
MHEMMTPAILPQCFCHQARKAARSVTRVYDLAFRPLHLHATQVLVLAAIAEGETESIEALGQRLGMDRTTLSRNLTPLRKQGLVQLGPEKRHRRRAVELTDSGREKLNAALPRWNKVQKEFRQLPLNYLGILQRLAAEAQAAEKKINQSSFPNQLTIKPE